MLKFKAKETLFSFGINLHNADFSLPFFENIDFSPFGAVEIDFKSIDSFKKLTHNNFIPREEIVSDLITASIVRGIIDQPIELKRDLSTKLAQKINSLPEKNRKIIIDFDLESAFLNQDYADNLCELLKILYQQLNRSKQLIIPLRIPATDSGIYQFVAKLINRLTFPVGICLDINPHELTGDFSYFGNLRWIKFDIQTVRVKYEPLLGNKLKQTALQPIADFLKEFWYDKSLIISPMNLKGESFENEIRNVIAIVDSIQQNIE